jgi:hypothetical protein
MSEYLEDSAGARRFWPVGMLPQEEPEICPKCGSSNVVAGDCKTCDEVRQDEADAPQEP